MAENKPRKSQSSTSDLRRALPMLAALLALLALWLGWGGVQQWRDMRRDEGLQQARDSVLSATQQALAGQLKQLADRIAATPVQTALRAGDSTAAAQAIGEGWKDANSVQVLPAGLEAAYAAPADFGFSKLALLEAALSENAPVARVVKEGKQSQLGLAAPAGDGVAYLYVPLSLLTDSFDRAAVPAEAYLAIRQGAYTVRETGNHSLADGAESLARPIGKTGMRVVAATPDGTEGPMGLGAISSLVTAVLSGVLAVLILLVARGRLNLDPRAKRASADDNEPTLVQALQREPLPRAPARETTEKDADAVTSSDKHIEVDPGIFRAYDIRGVVGETLSVDVAERIGQAIGTVLEEQGLTDIVVGRDGRLSGPELSDGLIEGLRKAGRNVIDIGMAPTPVAYFAAYHLRTGSSVAVTGSHNPPDYNGFKIVVGGQTLSGDAITDLYARINEKRLHRADGYGTLQQRDVAADYIQRIADDVQMDRPLKVVVDAGNGVAGDIAPKLLEAIGAEVIPLYCEVDGNFPNHHPDPSEPHNLEDLIQTVKRFDADIGLAFDGDGDRLGVVTKEGEIIFPDRLLMLFAADVLERNPGALIIYDVKCTGKLQGWVLSHGGTPLMWQTGHSLIKAKMRETGAELAGEMSGHFFFQERWYGFDDGLYSAARLLEVLAARAETPSETLNALPNALSTPEIKVPVAGSPHEIVAKFVASAQFEGARLTTIDGLRADWEDGWGLVRASNTTPILVLRFEADNKEALTRIKDEFRAHLSKVAPEITATF
ncbi:phosphomannomutase/phosphoglucomutase [Pseudoxanthomonas sacheonensis]|uniref:phosphomannomutase n=1 Tax=Pseudoxanthomonas sacheonensis TaxID=443615 RepID=A0ABU1RVV8_9GAMM|nr:phosphomannomutase/phosphoglucomutase [Pseudoxanthomonas sacheonensis]MDR6842045.1 phosphomannomutase/phosphoglucomutase [Pseudoxanthomonas sacheonensis]